MASLSVTVSVSLCLCLSLSLCVSVSVCLSVCLSVSISLSHQFPLSPQNLKSVDQTVPPPSLPLTLLLGRSVIITKPSLSPLPTSPSILLLLINSLAGATGGYLLHETCGPNLPPQFLSLCSARRNERGRERTVPLVGYY